MILGTQAALPSQYRLLLPNKKPQPRLGLIEVGVCVEKWRRKGPEVCEESGPICSEDQNLKVVLSRPPTVSLTPVFSM